MKQCDEKLDCRYQSLNGFCTWGGGMPFPCPENSFEREGYLSILAMLKDGYKIYLNGDIFNGDYVYQNALDESQYNWLIKQGYVEKNVLSAMGREHIVKQFSGEMRE